MNPSPQSLFFFNDPAPTEIYTLSLHDALPISLGQGHYRLRRVEGNDRAGRNPRVCRSESVNRLGDRKSTRLNSSHVSISYAVFCLKKKNEPPQSAYRQRQSEEGSFRVCRIGSP